MRGQPVKMRVRDCGSPVRTRAASLLIVSFLLLAVAIALASCGGSPSSSTYVVPIDSRGVQALTVVVTNDSYTPSSFLVKIGVPVEITFRELSGVTCGNNFTFPRCNSNPVKVVLASASDQQVVSFTPEAHGTYSFACTCSCTGHRASYQVI